MPIEYMVCFVCSELCIKSISPRKNVDLFSSVFKKIIPNYTIHTFQEVSAVIEPDIYCRRHNDFSLYPVNKHKID